MQIIDIISCTLSVSFIIFIINLIRKGVLREEYSFVWIFISSIFIFFSFYRKGLDILGKALGFAYPPALLFLVFLFGIIIFLVHLSIINTKQHNQIRTLAQKIALLEKKIETEMKSNIN
jgi:hypothetical protein